MPGTYPLGVGRTTNQADEINNRVPANQSRVIERFSVESSNNCGHRGALLYVFTNYLFTVLLEIQSVSIVIFDLAFFHLSS